MTKKQMTNLEENIQLHNHLCAFVRDHQTLRKSELRELLAAMPEKESCDGKPDGKIPDHKIEKLVQLSEGIIKDILMEKSEGVCTSESDETLRWASKIFLLGDCKTKDENGGSIQLQLCDVIYNKGTEWTAIIKIRDSMAAA